MVEMPSISGHFGDGGWFMLSSPRAERQGRHCRRRSHWCSAIKMRSRLPVGWLHVSAAWCGQNRQGGTWRLGTCMVSAPMTPWDKGSVAFEEVRERIWIYSTPNRFMCQQFLLSVSWSRLKQHQRRDRCPTTRSWLMMFTWQTLIRPLRVGCWASTNMLKESDDIWCQWSHSGNLMSTGSIRIQKGSNNCALLIAGNGLAAPQSCSNNPPEYWQSRGYTCLTIDQAARIEISQIYDQNLCLFFGDEPQ